MNETSYLIGRILGKVFSLTSIVSFIFGLFLKSRILLNLIILITAFIETIFISGLNTSYSSHNIPSSFFLALIVGLVVGNFTQTIRLSKKKKTKKIEKKTVENSAKKENEKKYEEEIKEMQQEEIREKRAEDFNKLKDNAVDGLSGLLFGLGSFTKKTTKFIDKKISQNGQTTQKLEELEQLKENKKITEIEYENMRKKILDKMTE